MYLTQITRIMRSVTILPRKVQRKHLEKLIYTSLEKVRQLKKISKVIPFALQNQSILGI